MKTADRSVPADFGDLATGYLRDWQSRNGERLGLEFDDLSIRALPNNAAGWQIIMKSTGLPADFGPESVLSLRDLHGILERKRDDAINRTVKQNQERQQTRRDFEDGVLLRKKADTLKQNLKDAKEADRKTMDGIRDGIANADDAWAEGIRTGKARGEETNKAVREGISRIGGDVSDFVGGVGRNVGNLFKD